MEKPVKILSVGHSYVVAMNRAILRELANDPHFEVTIGAPAQFQGSLRTISLEAEPEHSKIKLVSLPAYWTQKMHLFFYQPKALNQLMSQDFDGAHFWEEPYIASGFQLCRAAQKKQIPYLFRTAQSLVKKYVFPFSYFEQKSIQGASQFIAGGHLVYQAMRDKGWSLPGEVVTLAVDTKAFKPFSPEEKTKRQKLLGLPSPVIGYLGRLSEEKGCDLIMEVLTQIKSRPWSFLALGSGPYREKLLAWADREGLRDRVKVMLVNHDEVPQFLPAMDVMIAPSQTRSFWKEQFGRMIVEAFASGVPVIGSDSGEIPRVIGEAGLVLPEADCKAWQEAIESFLEQPESFEGYVERGLARAHNYSAETIAEQYKAVYRRLAGQ